MPSPQTIIHSLAFLVIIGQALVVLYLVTWPWRHGWARRMHDLARTYALPGAFFVAVISTLGSLYLSEVAKYPPCELCWFQRIAMYPQTILLALALLKRNRDIVYQALTLSVIGAGIAVYHYLVQRGVAIAPCSTVGYSVSCAKNFTMDYGYITIPVMALTGFALIAVAMFLHRRTPDAPLTT